MTKFAARAALAGLLILGTGSVATPAFAQASGTASGGAEGGAPRLPRAAPTPTPGQSATGTAPGGVGNGVIHPPTQVDPGIKGPTPPSQAFTMPVIPPPGTPGGKPDVIAK